MQPLTCACECGETVEIAAFKSAKFIQCPRCARAIRAPIDSSVTETPQSSNDANTLSKSATERSGRFALDGQPIREGESDDSRSTPAEALGNTAVGLVLVYYATIVAVIAAAIFYALLVTINGTGGFEQSGTTPFMCLVLVIGCVLAFATLILTSFVTLAGQCLCLSAPAAAGGKTYIRTVMLLQVFSFCGGLIRQLIAVAGGDALNSSIEMVTRVAVIAAGVVTLVCFIQFVRCVSHYIQRSDVANDAHRLIILFAVIPFLCLGVAGLTYPFPGQDTWVRDIANAVFHCASIVILTAFFVGVVMYTLLLRNVVRALSLHLATGTKVSDDNDMA